MAQIARNCTDPCDGFLRDKAYLIHDRATVFDRRFRNILKSSGVTSVRLPAQSPNLNAYAERFVRSIKNECLDRMIFFSEDQLRYACEQFIQHYHGERNHKGLKNRLIEPNALPANGDGEIVCTKRLGGLLKYYKRAA